MKHKRNKLVKHLSTPVMPHPSLHTGGSVAVASPCQHTGANRGMHQLGSVAVIRFSGEEPRGYWSWPVRAMVSHSGLPWARAHHRAFGVQEGNRHGWCTEVFYHFVFV